METPGKLIQRAEENRRMRRAYGGKTSGVRAEDASPARPLPAGHASYSRLMHSHDRMRTRHLSKNG